MGLIDSVVNYEQTIRNYGTAVTVGVFIGAAITTGCAFGVATYWFASQELIGTIASQIKTQAGHLLPGVLGPRRSTGVVGAATGHEGGEGGEGGGEGGEGGATVTTVAAAEQGGKGGVVTASPQLLRRLKARLDLLEVRVRVLEAAAGDAGVVEPAAAAAAGSGVRAGGVVGGSDGHATDAAATDRVGKGLASLVLRVVTVVPAAALVIGGVTVLLLASSDKSCGGRASDTSRRGGISGKSRRGGAATAGGEGSGVERDDSAEWW